MFIDKVDIYIKAGNGGNGCVSFRREKYVAKGGPDGGDGGRGGDVIFVVDDGTNTLFDFKKRRRLNAPDGADGMKRKFHGKSGENIVVPVPRGTIIKNAENGSIIKDMSDGEPFTAARGGRGGWGNTHFATPTRQIPRFAKSGLDGEEKNLTLELKMLADIGLTGFPNVGKSTFLSKISSARPKIADYHFTTLSPNLGVVTVYEKTFVAADIPGLIEGASGGLGLGHDFLRHIDRCRLIIHIFDISAGERENPLEDIIKINSELYNYSPELASRPQILAGNKSDAGYKQEHLAEVEKYAAEKGYKLFLISAVNGDGVGELIKTAAEMLEKLPPPVYYQPDFVGESAEAGGNEFSVEIEDGVYRVSGGWLKRLCNDINFDDYESLQYFQRVLKNSGIIEALEQKGIDEGDTVEIHGIEFDFYF